ncbi:MAG: Alpha-galactosidase, associated protein, partial [Gemmatimonadetes bacterium]|nr:Alpha-galactosidase, associated protein [Gemmatimonadota bacterium]
MLLLLLCLHATADICAQQAYFNPRDDQYRYLGMMRARAELRKATEEYDRARALADRGMLSPAELSDRRVAFERVRVDYLQQSLATLLAAAHLVINQATKQRYADGSLAVVVRVQSVSAQSAADEKARALIDTSLEAALQPDVIPTVFVSLKSESGLSGVVISRPYEQLVRNLRIGETRDIRFTLLKDVSDAVIVMAYADKVEERRVWLDNAGLSGSVSLRAAQFSLEGDFGAPVTYDLVLDRSNGGTAAMRLGTEGLPRAVRYEFRDPDSKARVIQVRFPDGQNTKRLQLALTLPSASEDALAPDVALKFSVTATPGDSVAHGIRMTPSRADLELIPRGVARVELRTSSLYYETSPKDSVMTDVTVRNVGSRALDRLTVAVDPASGWNARSEPAEITRLGLGESQIVRLTLVPKGSVPVGDYENRVRVISRGTDRRLDNEDKIIRVRVASAFGMWATVALLLALVGMTAGVVAAAKKL